MTDILERARSKSPYLRGSSAERMIDELVAEIELLTELLRAARGLLQFNNILYPDEIDDALEQKP
jgi:hypothetical protein